MNTPNHGKQEQKAVDKLTAMGVPEARARKTHVVETARMRDAWDEFWNANSGVIRRPIARLVRVIAGRWRTGKKHWVP